MPAVAHAIIHALQIDIDGAIQRLEQPFLRRHRLDIDSGIVHNKIEPAKAFVHHVEGGGDRRVIGYIDLQRERRAHGLFIWGEVKKALSEQISERREVGRYLNNRAENSYLPF